MCSPRKFGEHNFKIYRICFKRRIQTVEIHMLHEWCMYMQNFESFEVICYKVKRSKKLWKNKYIKQLIKCSFLWLLDCVANKLKTFKILHVHASLMKYMNFNGLNLLFEVDPILLKLCSLNLLNEHITP